MNRRCLAWLVVGSLGGCTPGIEVAQETEGDTETGSGTGTGTGDAGMTAASVSATSPSSQTAASMSASGADDDADDDDDAGVTTAMTTNVDDDTTGPGPLDTTAGDDESCTPGELDCPCDVGSTCEDDLQCVEGTCVAAPGCEPEGEPNDDEASAIDGGDLQCGADPIELEGAFDGTDIDWYTVAPMGGGICFGSPGASVAVDGDAEVTVCIYAECNMGGTNVGCGLGPGSGMPDTSPGGVDGCCGTGSASLDSVSCNSLDQTIVAWVRVSAAQDECLPYTLTLEY